MSDALVGVRAKDGTGAALTLTLHPGQPFWRGSGPGADDLSVALSVLFPPEKLSPSQGVPGADLAHKAAAWLAERVGLEILGVEFPQGGPEDAIY